MKTTFRLTLNRVIEIAILGDHKITICIGTGYDSDVFNSLLQDKAEIINHFKDVVSFADFSDFDNSIKIEICPVPFDHLARKWESFDEILSRVYAAKKIELLDMSLNDSCRMLLKTAYERLNFNNTVYQNILNIAATIARLDGKNKIEVCHIAEAIQYNTIFAPEFLEALKSQYSVLMAELKLNGVDINLINQN